MSAADSGNSVQEIKSVINRLSSRITAALKSRYEQFVIQSWRDAPGTQGSDRQSSTSVLNIKGRGYRTAESRAANSSSSIGSRECVSSTDDWILGVEDSTIAKAGTTGSQANPCIALVVAYCFGITISEKQDEKIGTGCVHSAGGCHT